MTDTPDPLDYFLGLPIPAKPPQPERELTPGEKAIQRIMRRRPEEKLPDDPETPE